MPSRTHAHYEYRIRFKDLHDSLISKRQKLTTRLQAPNKALISNPKNAETRRLKNPELWQPLYMSRMSVLSYSPRVPLHYTAHLLVSPLLNVAASQSGDACIVLASSQRSHPCMSTRANSRTQARSQARKLACALTPSHALSCARGGARTPRTHACTYARKHAHYSHTLASSRMLTHNTIILCHSIFSLLLQYHHSTILLFKTRMTRTQYSNFKDSKALNS